jgi:hypothetical protein
MQNILSKNKQTYLSSSLINSTLTLSLPRDHRDKEVVLRPHKLKVGDMVNLKEHPAYEGNDEELHWSGVLTKVQRCKIAIALFKEGDIESLFTLPPELVRRCQM